MKFFHFNFSVFFDDKIHFAEKLPQTITVLAKAANT
jgi:hypothetical protein